MTHKNISKLGKVMVECSQRATTITEKHGKKIDPVAIHGRFIEECVELCLTGGLTPTQIMSHVMDAIHNEALKADEYPSKLLPDPETTRLDHTAEVADVLIQVSHIINHNTLQYDTVIGKMESKMHTLELCDVRNELDVDDKGFIYRKSRGTKPK